MEYIPDYWVVVKITNLGKVYHKIFANWSGGYTTGDSWKLNSGIVDVQENEDEWVVTGHSNSVYRCRKHSYGVNTYGASVLRAWEDQLTKLEDNRQNIEVILEQPEDLRIFIEAEA